MPNIATVLKDEIVRLTRKEFRLQMEPLRKQILAQKKTITALRSDIDQIARGAKALAKGARKTGQVEADPTAPVTPVRFSAGGLRKLREKFGLSREAFAPLLGASAKALYTWEQDGIRPRPETIQKIALLRRLSKPQVLALLEQHAPKVSGSKSPAVTKPSKKMAKKSATHAKATKKSSPTRKDATAA